MGIVLSFLEQNMMTFETIITSSIGILYPCQCIKCIGGEFVQREDFHKELQCLPNEAKLTYYIYYINSESVQYNDRHSWGD